MKKILLLVILALCAQMSFAQSLPSYVPSDGLVGYWPFNGNANDESGNGNNGIKNQVGESADRFGNLKSSYYFDGVSSYIGVANTSSVELFGNDFSISVWVNSQSIDNWGSNLISKSFNNLTIGNRDNGSSGLQNTNIKYGVGFDTYGKNYGIYPDILPKTGWNHIVCVKTSNGYDYYINNQKYTLPYNYNNVSKSDINSALFFGKRNGGGGGANFNGYLDDIGIYNRALTQQEITAMYNGVNYSDTCNAVSGSLTNGLVGYWPFCGNANDDSGNGNNGTNNGATLTTDRFGNTNSAYDFDGIANYISVPDNSSLDFTNQMSISLWYNFDNLNFDSFNNIWQGRLIDKTQNGNSTSGYWSSLVSSNNSSSPWYCNGQNSANASASFANNGGHSICSQKSNWYNLVYTFENGFYKIYLDGILVDFNTTSIGTMSTNNFPVLFGYANDTSDQIYHYKGKLDDIGIWNRALSPTEVSQLYNQNQCFTNITVTDTLIINVGQLSFNDPVVWANNITIAPNPASTQININFNNITDLNGGTIKIINSLGQQVATTPITLSGTNTTMPLTNWGGTGLYFVQILNAQGIVVDVKKIILQ